VVCGCAPTRVDELSLLQLQGSVGGNTIEYELLGEAYDVSNNTLPSRAVVLPTFLTYFVQSIDLPSIPYAVANHGACSGLTR
jgi:hypothetical protein